MGRYDPLNEYLRSDSGNEIILSFSDIEKVLGFELPPSAYKHRAWWANGGHSQAYAWLNVGYKVDQIDFSEKVVTFCKTDASMVKDHKKKKERVNKQDRSNVATIAPTFSTEGKSSMVVCGYEFSYLQDILPDCNEAGNVIKFYPQNDYINKNNLPLSNHGKGAFCRFSIKAEDWPGVYLWLVDDQIIYIGETAGLRRRFNMGYGNISPRNCYVGGQSTNCKMNKVVLNMYEQGKIISLYFYNTTDYKRVELELLRNINTVYNKKDN